MARIFNLHVLEEILKNLLIVKKKTYTLIICYSLQTVVEEGGGECYSKYIEETCLNGFLRT